MICRNSEQEMILETNVSELVPCPFSHAHVKRETSLSNYAYRGFDMECVGIVECTCGAQMRVSAFCDRSVDDEEAEADRVMQIALRKAAEAWNRRDVVGRDRNV